MRYEADGGERGERGSKQKRILMDYEKEFILSIPLPRYHSSHLAMEFLVVQNPLHPLKIVKMDVNIHK